MKTIITYICETCGSKYDNKNHISPCRTCRKDVCFYMGRPSRCCGNVCVKCHKFICKHDTKILDGSTICDKCIKNAYWCDECDSHHSTKKKLPKCIYCDIDISPCDNKIYYCARCNRKGFCNVCMDGDICKSCSMKPIQ
jgi:hypothetical protein